MQFKVYCDFVERKKKTYEEKTQIRRKEKKNNNLLCIYFYASVKTLQNDLTQASTVERFKLYKWNININGFGIGT